MDALRGLVAGVSGGLVGSLCMNLYQSLTQGNGGGSSDHAGGQASQEQHEDPATVEAAEALVGRELRSGEKKVADPVMHYGFGAFTGAAYGMAAEYAPGVAAGAGLPFGAAVWVAADEVAVPAMGFAKPAWEQPLSTHASSLAAHFVYGAAAELTRRLVVRLWR